MSADKKRPSFPKEERPFSRLATGYYSSFIIPGVIIIEEIIMMPLRALTAMMDVS
jgi:hypothetical protein